MMRPGQAKGPYAGQAENDIFDLIFPGNVNLTITDSATFADLNLSNLFTVTLTESITFNNPKFNGVEITAAAPSQKYDRFILRVVQAGAGSFTITWGNKFEFSTDIASPTLSTAAGDFDYIGFVWNNALEKWDCIALVQGF